MTKVMKGRVRGVEGRNWELERRSQGTRRVQGEAVVQRLPKPLRGFALEEQAYIPKPWKEVGRKALQYSGLENSMGCTVNGVAKSRTRLSD